STLRRDQFPVSTPPATATNLAADHPDLSRSHELESARIDAVLDFEHAGGERGGIVGIMNAQALLGDDRAASNLRHHERDQRGADLRGGLKQGLVGIEALEPRQKRWVDVDEPPLPAADEPRRQQPHEAGKAYEIDRMPVERVCERAFEAFAILAERGMIDDRGRNSLRARV